EVWIEEDYPLGFKFEEIFTTHDGYTRTKVTGIVQNIFFEYGIKKLLPALKQAVMAVFRSFQEDALLLNSLGKRPAEDTIDTQESSGSRRRTFDDCHFDESQESLFGQPVLA
ncbi:MAG: hypothetical protein Q9187_005757, partial [Circinaria calcarea]